MIERLIPKYPAFMVIGIAIVAVGLFVLLVSRDVVIALWVDKFFDGESAEGLFNTARTADLALAHTLAIWMFLGLSFIMLGIGFAIATIVQNLRVTGESYRAAYSSAGVAGTPEVYPTEPWYGRWFTRLIFAGIAVMIFFFLVTVWWAVNVIGLDFNPDGSVSGASNHTYLMIEQVLGVIIFSGKFLAMGLVIFGILTGLASIIWNLSYQAVGLPMLTRRALGRGLDDVPPFRSQPHVPTALLWIGGAAFSVIAVSMVLGVVHAGLVGWQLGRIFEGTTPETVTRLAGAFERIVNPLIFMGLATLFFTIALLLLNIVRWLRDLRQHFGEVVAEASGGAVPVPSIGEPLLVTKLVPLFAVFGILVMTFFFFTMTAVRELNFNNMLSLQFAGEPFMSSLRFDRVIAPIIGATRFIGIVSIMVAIGLALVTIVVNLRATALLLPAGFSKLIPAARGERPEEEDLTVYEPMQLAPWNLFAPLAAGAVVAVSATLPVVILLAIFIQRRLGEMFAGLAGPDGSDKFETAFWVTNLLGASWQPWMLAGMGLILFAIARFFTTIVGFVEARRMVIAEGTEAIAEAVLSKGTQAEEPALVAAGTSADGK